MGATPGCILVPFLCIFLVSSFVVANVNQVDDDEEFLPHPLHFKVLRHWITGKHYMDGFVNNHVPGTGGGGNQGGGAGSGRRFIDKIIKLLKFWKLK